MKTQIAMKTGRTSARADTAEALARVLADTYTLYLKTHGFHWNVKGPHFYALHKMFEDQYREMAEAVDEIAERLRALGEAAPAGYAVFTRLNAIGDTGGAPRAEEMVRILAEDNETVARRLREAIAVAAAAGDDATVDLFVERLQVHEKNVWMLRSTLEP